MAKTKGNGPMCLECKWFRLTKEPAKAENGTLIGTDNPVCGYYGYWFQQKVKPDAKNGVDEYELAVECEAFEGKGDDDMDLWIDKRLDEKLQRMGKDEEHYVEQKIAKLASEIKHEFDVRESGRSKKSSEPTAITVTNVETLNINKG